jgi:hypothetical protein
MDPLPLPISCPESRLLPPGSAVFGCVSFVDESRGNPLRSYPSLTIGTRPYNLWLAERVLDPVLGHWNREFADQAALAAAVADDLEWSSRQSRAAFQEVLPLAIRLGDPAILAAMGVTANLQRTLALLAEIVLGNRRFASLFGGTFRLSRFMCGLIDYPEDIPYFPGRIHAPAHADRLPPRRRDPRHLGNALWCSVGEINRRCDDALSLLQAEIRGANRALRKTNPAGSG